jgi:hypothetical protein
VYSEYDDSRKYFKDQEDSRYNLNAWHFVEKVYTVDINTQYKLQTFETIIKGVLADTDESGWETLKF